MPTGESPAPSRERGHFLLTTILTGGVGYVFYPIYPARGVWGMIQKNQVDPATRGSLATSSQGYLLYLIPHSRDGNPESKLDLSVVSCACWVGSMNCSAHHCIIYLGLYHPQI